jgi:deazaflavin-dependent oxidoreductase (nitroreductase family)
MSTSPTDYNAKVIAEFHENGGHVGGMLEGMPVLLLHHRGAKSGAEYVNPLAYLRDGDRYAIFASAAGAPKHPGWYHNLKAHPEASIEVGTDTLEVVAKEAEGEERNRLFAAQAEQIPQFAGYAEKTDRVIPVILLTPTDLA